MGENRTGEVVGTAGGKAWSAQRQRGGEERRCVVESAFYCRDGKSQRGSDESELAMSSHFLYCRLRLGRSWKRYVWQVYGILTCCGLCSVYVPAAGSKRTQGSIRLSRQQVGTRITLGRAGGKGWYIYRQTDLPTTSCVEPKHRHRWCERRLPLSTRQVSACALHFSTKSLVSFALLVRHLGTFNVTPRRSCIVSLRPSLI